jgi:DNA-binding HxlR family transcriptional regulator
MSVENGASNCSMSSPEDDEFAIYGGAGGNGTNAGEVEGMKVENAGGYCYNCGQHYNESPEEHYEYCSASLGQNLNPDISDVAKEHLTQREKLQKFIEKSKGCILPFSAENIDYDGTTLTWNGGACYCEIDGRILWSLLAGSMHNKELNRSLSLKTLRMNRLSSVIEDILRPNQFIIIHYKE